MDIPVTTENIPGTIPLRDANGNLALGTLLGVATEIADNTVSSGKIAPGSVSDVHIDPSAGISLTKLGVGNLPAAVKVGSSNLKQEAVTDAALASGISLSKLSSGTLPSGIAVTAANIAIGTIVDSNISASATIALTKLAPGTLPSSITISSSNISGKLNVASLTDGNARQLLQTNAAGNGVEWTNNVEVPGTLAANGAVTLNSTLNVSGATTLGVLGAGSTTVSSLSVTGTSTLNDDITVANGKNIVLDTGTGTKIGTSTSQKLGFFNKTPVAQPAMVAAPTAGTTIDTQARTAINDIIGRLQSLGLIA